MKRGHAVVAAIGFLVFGDARSQTRDDKCVVDHPHAGSGATVVVAMSMVNDGTPCSMQRHFGGEPASSLVIRGRPSNGTLSTTRNRVSYLPNPGYEGNDAFDAQWFGSGFGPNAASHNIRTRVQVMVRAKSDEAARQAAKPSP